mgnify:CR=1 FL=1
MKNQTTIKLLPEFVLTIQETPELQGRLAAATGKSVATILRWCRESDSRLTMLSVLIAIREYLQLPKHFVLTGHVELENAE